MPDTVMFAQPEALKAAQEYLGLGWAPVPLRAGTKAAFHPFAPGGKDWPRLQLDASNVGAAFAASNLNIGVILGVASGGLVDVDLDCEEAIALASTFLPATGSTFGRESKPRAHRLYQTEDCRTVQYKDPNDKAMLVELRGDGAQTMFPGSVHESGEVVEWFDIEEPSHQPRRALDAGVGRLAAASILARHWPATGGRHDAQLTLTAFLTRNDWATDDIAVFVEAVSRAAGAAPEAGKREVTARDAEARRHADRPLRGFPAMVELFGSKTARAVASWLGIENERAAAFGGAVSTAEEPLPSNSHVVIARSVLAEIAAPSNDVVFTDGGFYIWAETHWRELADHEVRQAVQALDGRPYLTENAKIRHLRLTKAVVDGVLCEMATIAAAPGFFEETPIGLNCASGFICLSPSGEVRIEPHKQAYRQRHVLPGRWRDNDWREAYNGSLLERALEGFFKGAEDRELRIQLVSELAGAAAFGLATALPAPKAVLLYGDRASNGKSTLLDTLRSLVSADACASVSPRNIGDQRIAPSLIGKLLNAADEIGDQLVSSETFKAAVTGDRLLARAVYKQPVEFRCRALHVLAGNRLPHFSGGVDAGVRRRLMVLPFDRVIPPEERMPGLAQRIAETEADLLLAVAVDGARRLIKSGAYTEPPSSREALQTWLCAADPVRGFLEDRQWIAPDPDSVVFARELYAAYRAWAIELGFTPHSLPAQPKFTLRVKANGAPIIDTARRANGTCFRGIRLIKADRGRDEAVRPK